MNDRFSAEIERRLEEIRAQGLFRELRRVDSPQSTRVRIEGRGLLNFSSNDYLGLANHPLLKEAAIKAVEKFGGGSGASRLICGSLAPHHDLEDALAAFKKVDAALSFSSGYAAAVGTICALVGKDDVIVLDKLVHASIVDAARLSGAKLRVFSHNDLNELDDILRWSANRDASATGERRSQTLIVTESIFSMDGDAAPLREIVVLKEKYGAWLMVDEAHATGMFGKHRGGLAEALDVSDQIEIQMGTLGKALGSSGGYICGSRELIEYLVNRARTFIFSTAPVPAAAGAAKAGVEIVQSREGEARCKQLWSLVEQTSLALAKIAPNHRANRSAIIPLIFGAEENALKAASALREAEIFVPAIRFPTVPRNQARLRITLTAAHTDEDLANLFRALSPILVNLKSEILKSQI
ncbi:MAG TPA: 8-amino-7-oxononanoate synthase [Verrucomicrobiae bacterium]|nr:8-amino-7-oxononanoate synthase [Verrucomicrobiae bacterium]